MKKLFSTFLLSLLIVIILPSFGEAQIQRCLSSGLRIGDGVISSSTEALCGVLVITDGSNDASITVYDHPQGAVGNILFKGTVTGAANFGGATFEIPVHAKRGVYVNISGTGANYIIYLIK